MTLDDMYDRRRDLQLRAEAIGKGDECWERMGVAHRHLARVESGVLTLVPGVENEIIKCFDDVDHWLSSAEAA